MKKYFLTIIFCSSILFLSAQEEIVPPKAVTFNHEIGLNTSFFQNLIADENSNNSPYSLSYKLIFNDFALRIGGGGTFNNQKTQEEGFADSQLEVNYTTDLRIGLERRNFLKDSQWLLFYGIDLIGYQRVGKLVQDSGFDKVTDINQSLGYGGGLSLGLQFYINEHLSVSTEGNFYFYSQANKTARLFENFPDFDDIINTSTSMGVINQLPTSVYLIYRF